MSSMSNSGGDPKFKSEILFGSGFFRLAGVQRGRFFASEGCPTGELFTLFTIDVLPLIFSDCNSPVGS